MMSNEKKKQIYQAIVWRQGENQVGERTIVLANDLEAAELELKQRYGDDIIFSLYNEEDANKPR